ncbi:MAG: hypothetical protein JWQ27_3246 [Ferruginibacter sp.]|nr:hypothetical protein [Ferruginibacter sp.]
MIAGLTTATAQSNVNSQDYKTALGVKFYPGAITLKHFVDDKAAVEGIGYFFNYGTRITGLYEIHGDINNAPGLKWYIGPGAHIGFYSNKYGGATSVGVDGVLGLDYKFKGAPINMSLDWQPSFEFGNKYNNGFNGNWGGLAIRYVF